MNSDPSSSPDQTSADTNVSRSEIPSESRTAGRRARTAWIVWAVVLLVAGPVCYREFPREMARWSVAAAQNSQTEGDGEGALGHLDKALAWDPDNRAALIQRARWRADDKDYSAALADYDRLIERFSDESDLYIERSLVRQHAGQFDAAIRDWQRVEQLAKNASTMHRASALNGLAYARAVGNVELKEGLEDIELAIKLAGANAAFLDTRGFLHYRLGNHDQALVDLNEAVPAAEAELAELLKRLEPDGRPTALGKRFAEIVENHRRNVAVIRYHRALVNDQLGQREAAEADRQRVIELGFEPGEGLF